MQSQGTADEIAEAQAQNDLLAPSFVNAVSEALEQGDTEAARGATMDLRAADLADLIEFLRPDLRIPLITALGSDLPAEMFSELQEPIRDELLKEMPVEQLAEVVGELDSDDAVYLLEDLDENEQIDILSRVSRADRARLRRSLEYPEDTAGRLMQSDFVAVPPFWSVGQTIDYMREARDLPDSFAELYVIDPAFHLVGTVPLSFLLRSRRPKLISEITGTDIHTFSVLQDQEEVARDFERYNLLSAPVVDEDRRLVGIITADDVVEVVQEEAGEDIFRLAGVGDEGITENFAQIAGRRFTWLFVNLLTAILASVIIGFFDATLQQQVALAILMPIVASMGGNAGTQTMTVAVRALAMKDITAVNTMRVVGRELAVGLINGLLFAILLAGAVLVWFGSSDLGIIIAAAMVVNMFAAALGGIGIPILLDKLGIDPAVASSVFVTTVTDVVGFFAFLGLASLWFL
ncbi:MAG: magnesium transporter [Dichotomicrobium sp.]